MNPPQFLVTVCFVIFLVANVTVLFRTFPAYRRHRHPAFLLLALSATLGVLVTVSDWTVGTTPMAPREAYWLACARQVFFTIDAICYAAGVTLLARAYEWKLPKPDFAASGSQSIDSAEK